MACTAPSLGNWAISTSLLQFLRFLSRCLESLERLHIAQKSILNLRLREAVPLIVPGRLDVLARFGSCVLLTADFRVITGFVLSRNNIRIFVHGFECVADS